MPWLKASLSGTCSSERLLKRTLLCSSQGVPPASLLVGDDAHALPVCDGLLLLSGIVAITVVSILLGLPFSLSALPPSTPFPFARWLTFIRHLRPITTMSPLPLSTSSSSSPRLRCPPVCVLGPFPTDFGIRALDVRTHRSMVCPGGSTERPQGDHARVELILARHHPVGSALLWPCCAPPQHRSVPSRD